MTDNPNVERLNKILARHCVVDNLTDTQKLRQWMRIHSGLYNELTKYADLVAFAERHGSNYSKDVKEDVLVLPPKFENPILQRLQKLFGSDRETIASDLFNRLADAQKRGNSVNVRVFPGVGSSLEGGSFVIDKANGYGGGNIKSHLKRSITG